MADEESEVSELKANYQEIRVRHNSSKIHLLYYLLSFPSFQSKYEELTQLRLNVSKLEKECLTSVSKLTGEARELQRSPSV